MEEKFVNFDKDISWLNMERREPVLTVYAMLKNAIPIHGINVSMNPALIKKITLFHLQSEIESAPIRIDVFDIYPDIQISLLKTYQEIIEEAFISLLSQKVLLVWCMFEGGLMDVANLFLDWEAKSTYAFCLPGEKPEFAFSNEERESEEWRFKMNILTKKLREHSIKN